MKIMDKQTLADVKDVLSKLKRQVRVLLFVDRMVCGQCENQSKILQALTEINPKVKLEVLDLQKHAATAEKYGVDKVPCTCVIGDRDHGIRFYGVTGGFEFSSLLDAIVMEGTGSSNLPQALVDFAANINKPIHLEVMVTLSCPYCHRMVRLANQLAFENDNITSDMVEASEFPLLVQKYGVTGAPKTIINRDKSHAFDGALPPVNVVLELLKVSNPEKFEQIEEQVRRAQGYMASKGLLAGKLYDLIVVGAGPAAMSAAIYASRKGLEVGLVGSRPGGQVKNTASIENWLGIPSIGGSDLVELFRDHMERYPIDEKFGEQVELIQKKGSVFVLRGSSGDSYNAKSVVYAAGKEYRRLGVPGEERFLGKGVAFCATCDAPLYIGKRVAVIGGGNSAFTAARDLLPFAREIFLINNSERFTADSMLVAEVGRSKRVFLYKSTQTKAFLGEEKLTGVRVEGPEGGFDLPVEGVFLEIGLNPNSAPLKELVSLNSLGEIPVGRDQSTEVRGLFAAGDVTDEDEKQIIVAAGSGAKAALSAYRFLSDSAHGHRGKEDWEDFSPLSP